MVNHHVDTNAKLSLNHQRVEKGRPGEAEKLQNNPQKRTIGKIFDKVMKCYVIDLFFTFDAKYEKESCA